MMDGRQSGARPPAGSSTLRLTVPATPQSGKLVRDTIAGFARAQEIPEPDITEFIIALGEALANAFEHGRSTGDIETTCWVVDGDGLIATVIDSGRGFTDRARAIEPGRMVPPPDMLSERGRGFAIMRQCTDHVAVRSIPGRGTAVVLVRYPRNRRRRRGRAHAAGG